MKIALCLSGQPRYIDIGYRSLYDCLLSKYDVDVFSYIWYDDSMCGQEFGYGLQYNRCDKWETGLDKKIIDYYQPKKYKFAAPKEFSMNSFEGANFESIVKPSNVLSMFYSIKQVNNLRQEYEIDNKIEYDLVIRGRTDLILNNFNISLNNIETDKVYCYKTNITMLDNIEMCNDQFAIGNKKNMNVYSSVFDYLEYYWKDYKIPSMIGERVLTTHLFHNKISTYHCNDKEMYVSIYTG